MELLDRCFVDELREPVKLIDVFTDRESPEGATATRSQNFANQQELSTYIDDATNRDYSCRFISICQRNSWQPLQITRPMLSRIVSTHEMSESFWDLPSCFYHRNLKLEEAFCLPYTQSRDGPWIEISYTIRYPELKQGEDEPEWTVRQSGIYHRFNIDTRQIVFVLFSPTPNSKVHIMAEEQLQNRNLQVENSLFWLHDLLFSAHLPAWRQYTTSQEHQFLPIANRTFATFIDEPLRIGYDNLSTLISLESRFLQINTLLASTSDVLRGLVGFLEDLEEQPQPASDPGKFTNKHRQCMAYTSTATYLQQRTQTTAQLLANTLSFRDQVIAKEQNANMLQLNKSAVFITTVTLIYVPASFVATFFGMNFFGFDQDNGRIVGTTIIWIYVVCTLGLTAISVIFYYWLVQHDGLLFRRLAPKVRKRDWTSLNFGLRRRGTTSTDLTV